MTWRRNFRRSSNFVSGRGLPEIPGSEQEHELCGADRSDQQALAEVEITHDMCPKAIGVLYETRHAVVCEHVDDGCRNDNQSQIAEHRRLHQGCDQDRATGDTDRELEAPGKKAFDVLLAEVGKLSAVQRSPAWGKLASREAPAGAISGRTACVRCGRW